MLRMELRIDSMHGSAVIWREGTEKMMKRNLLLEYSEKFAVDILTFCTKYPLPFSRNGRKFKKAFTCIINNGRMLLYNYEREAHTWKIYFKSCPFRV